MGVPKPNLRMPLEDQCIEEKIKREYGLIGELATELRDYSMANLSDSSKLIIKSHGIYLQFDRKLILESIREWMYMIRITIPGGGPITREQWGVLDDLSEKYTKDKEGNPLEEDKWGSPSLRLTTRQNIQFHWVKKENLVDIVKGIAESGFFTLNGCGDNVRNVMGCPISRFSTIYDANAMAHEFGEFFRLPLEPHIEIFGIDPERVKEQESGVHIEHFKYSPQLLNRKFKIGFSALHYDENLGCFIPDNCVEVRTNDIGVAPVIENNKLAGYQVFIGGGQGEKNGKPTFCAHGLPFGIFRSKGGLRQGLDAIVQVHQEIGDRKNRHFARLRYGLKAMGNGDMEKGLKEYRSLIEEKIGNFELPNPNLDVGARNLHHGWIKQQSNDLWLYGLFIESGRIINGQNGQLKSMVRYLVNKYPTELMVTPNQDLLFTNIPDIAKEDFIADMQRSGYGKRNGVPYSTLRKNSVACVGLYTCPLAVAESEKFLPKLIDELEKMGYGDIAESVGISGCERQCSRPATKTIGWIGKGKGTYQIKLFGSEDARNQGLPLILDGKLYMRMVPQNKLTDVTAVLFDFYKTNANTDETMGYFNRRIGMETIINHLMQNPKTAPLMQNTYNPNVT